MHSSAAAIDYATVLYDVCEERGIINEIIYDLATLMKIHDEEISKFIRIPIISKTVKKEVLDELLKQDIADEIVNLMKILIDNRQEYLFNEIIIEFREIFQRKNDIKVVHVTTARELSSVAREKIRISLEEKLNCFVVLSTVVKPSLIGGIIFEYDDYQLDNTIKRQLKQIKKSIKG